MVALWNRADHYIFILWFLSIFYLSIFFFPRLISAAAHWVTTYFHTWCGLSANLECRSEMCSTRLAENAGPQKVAKNRHLGTVWFRVLAALLHGTLVLGVSQTLRR